ncbi:MAG: hypothetical protein Q7J16_06850 [Candidatus Cloacimonadales bacterium]|nr:hypothetical protein [Candidatus Cloacimonadales bacterium]
MKKVTKIILNLILAGIVSAISYLGFKKGVETVGKKMDENPPQPSLDSKEGEK